MAARTASQSFWLTVRTSIGWKYYPLNPVSWGDQQRQAGTAAWEKHSSANQQTESEIPVAGEVVQRTEHKTCMSDFHPLQHTLEWSLLFLLNRSLNT